MILRWLKKVPLTTWIMILGWMLWEGLDFYLWQRLGKYDVDFQRHVYFKLGGIFLSICLTFLLYTLYARLRKYNLQVILTILLVLSCSLIMGYLRILTNQILGYFIWQDAVLYFWSRVMMIKSLNTGLLFLIFSSLFYLIHDWQDLRTEKEKALRASALAHEAQLGMLRYQLNPHFLFNSLNSIRSMIAESPEKARTMVTELSDFFRYTLINSDDKEVKLAQEIEAIQNYLMLQKIRFEDRLQVELDIEEEAAQVRVPCFLIHPLLENAVKFGMKTSAMPLQIQVVAAVQHSSLIIRISNTGKMVHPKDDREETVGTGTGLKNIQKRLALAYPDRYSFQIIEDEGWVHVSMMVDLENNG